MENRAAIDKWTGGHVLLGAVLRYRGWSFGQALALAIVWEVIEWPLLESRIPGRRNESPVNLVTDIAANMVGWGLAKNLTKRPRNVGEHHQLT